MNLLSGYHLSVGILFDVQVSDSQLLTDFVRMQDQRAFGTLVQRHINLVYSAALRRTRDSHLADDITQTVFVILARKAASLTPDVILSAWLHRTTRYAAMDALKLRGRRIRHEKKAAEMRPSQYDPEMEMRWPRASELLDQALDALGEGDRRAVMLRYYENKSFADVGATLGVAEEAARKRVSRAAEKLRGWLSRRGGGVVTAALLGTMLQTRLAEAAAPSTLFDSIIASAATPQAASITVDATIKTMWWEQVRVMAACAAVAAALAIGAGAGVYAWMNHEPTIKQTAPNWK